MSAQLEELVGVQDALGYYGRRVSTDGKQEAALMVMAFGNIRFVVGCTGRGGLALGYEVGY